MGKLRKSVGIWRGISQFTQPADGRKQSLASVFLHSLLSKRATALPEFDLEGWIYCSTKS